MILLTLVKWNKECWQTQRTKTGQQVKWDTKRASQPEKGQQVKGDTKPASKTGLKTGQQVKGGTKRGSKPARKR